MESSLLILKALYRRRYQLIIIPCVAAVLIAWFTRNSPRNYKTSARLYLNLQETKATSLSDEDLKQYQVQSYFTNTIELLRSAATIENVRLMAIEKALENDEFFKIGNEDLIAKKAEVSVRVQNLLEQGGRLNGNDPLDSLMIAYLNYHDMSAQSLSDKFSAYRIMDSNFMKFEMVDQVPGRVQGVANLFLAALMKENAQLARNKILGHKDVIEKLVRQAKLDLDKKIKRLETYKVSHNIINLGEHTKAIVVYLVQLEGQRASLMGRMASGKAGKTEIVRTMGTGNELILDVSGNEEILELKRQLRVLNERMLNESFKQNRLPGEGSLAQNIVTTKVLIDSKVSDLVRKTSYDPSRVQLDLVGKFIAYDLEVETSHDMIGVLDFEIQRVRNYAKTFAPFESTIGAFEQDISTAQNVYLVLLNKLNLAQTLEEGSSESVIEVIDPPFLPVRPEPSKRPLIILAGAVSVFIMMCVVFIVIHLMDATITTVEKFEQAFTLPVVSALPFVEQKVKSSAIGEGIELIDRQQMIKLHQAVISRCMGEKNVLLVTSAQRNEGKHYVAMRLREVLSVTEYRVAFVDADSMSTSLTEGFVDIRELLRGDGIIRNRQALLDKVNNLRTENDLVVIVASPLSLGAETNFWMEISKHVLFVFRANRVVTKVDRRIEKMLKETPMRFAMSLVNALTIDNMEDYLGEIPRKRSYIRIVLKKLIYRNFL